MSLRQKPINSVLPLPQRTHDIKTRATAEAWSKKRHSYESLPTHSGAMGSNTGRSPANEMLQYTNKPGAVVLSRVFVTR
jgi:hypothetical protein